MRPYNNCCKFYSCQVFSRWKCVICGMSAVKKANRLDWYSPLKDESKRSVGAIENLKIKFPCSV